MEQSSGTDLCAGCRLFGATGQGGLIAALFMTAIGIFGGTFDPIHYGHLRTAFELQHMLELDEIRFIPCGIPPHRDTTVADSQTRLAMVQAAVAGQPGFIVDDRETRRDGPAYTVETLSDLRAEYPDRALSLIVGMDAFLGLPQWYEWRRLLPLAHLIVAHRPGWTAPASGPLGELLAEKQTLDSERIIEQRSGTIFVHAVTQLEISSSAVRELVAAGGDPRFLVPDEVRNLIEKSGCYC